MDTSYPSGQNSGPKLQRPDGLTTSGRFNSNYHKYFINKQLIPARDGQFTPAEYGQIN